MGEILAAGGLGYLISAFPSSQRSMPLAACSGCSDAAGLAVQPYAIPASERG